MGGTETLTAVERIKEEIDRLTEEQSNFLRTATYVGMTPDEAKEYDKRRAGITSLVQELELLEKAL